MHDPLGHDLPVVHEIAASRPLARVPHICTVCGLPIAIGTRYSRHIIRNDDLLDRRKNLQVVKWHLPFCPENATEGSA